MLHGIEYYNILNYLHVPSDRSNLYSFTKYSNKLGNCFNTSISLLDNG